MNPSTFGRNSKKPQLWDLTKLNIICWGGGGGTGNQCQLNLNKQIKNSKLMHSTKGSISVMPAKLNVIVSMEAHLAYVNTANFTSSLPIYRENAYRIPRNK